MTTTSDLFQKLDFEKQFHAKKVDTYLKECSPEQLHDLALYYAVSLLYQQQQFRDLAKNLAKRVSNPQIETEEENSEI